MPDAVSDLEVRDGISGRTVHVWAIWSPCDDCWASIQVWKRAEGWKAVATARRLSQFWPFPMAVVEVFEPVDDSDDAAIAAVLSALPPPPPHLRLTREELSGIPDGYEVDPSSLN